MKKFIVIFAIVFGSSFSGFSQFFFQGGLGADLLEFTDYENRPTSKSKNINLQIGRFVNERKMRSFSFSYNFGLKSEDKNQNWIIDGNNYKTDKISTLSYMRLAYERKVTYANTEFDDPWNIYSIVTYGLQLNTHKTEYTDPTVNKISSDAGKEGGFAIDIGIGTGIARKFNISTYAYCDIMYIEPIYYSSFAYSQISLQVGIRKLF